MKKCISLVFDCIQSVEMRDYLKELWEDDSDLLDIKKLIQIIICAPLSLEQKQNILSAIGADYLDEDQRLAKLANRYAKKCQDALKQRYNRKNAVFWLIKHRNQKETILSEDFFSDFDSAIKYINYVKTIEDKNDNGETDNDCIWYSLIKLIPYTGQLRFPSLSFMPPSEGKYYEYCKWILNREGELWYYSATDDYDSENIIPLNGDLGMLKLPVPFKPGDIVVVDSRPFVKKKYAVIVNTEFNHSIGVHCLYIKDKTYARFCVFQRNKFSKKERSPLSAIYRARLADENDLNINPALIEISEAIHAQPKVAVKINHLIANNHNSRNVLLSELLKDIEETID